ncbi:type IV secretion system DNA-binding domain-containing protein [Roseomonas mucosa]|uniref:type IV secretion system DNA-binding domain-containing protein n=1 Tax=Roseomonas mucosa TaxID=207340 RepID=UPI0028CF4AC3|nr:type IV secretion system DNA-binding domain-containing protein [Roseomonas mucosa]MDT8362590.1 type IV secretion system DNA-binding domain-containing protein [Roseomonas mucosa]
MATAGSDKLAQLCEGTPAQRYFVANNEKMLAGILGTLAPAVGSLQQLAGAQGAPFSVRHWMREGQGTLWMPYRAKQIPALRALISCWVGLAIAEALSLPLPPSETRRLWFHVDELDALGRIQGLKDALARLRKVGGCVVLGLQSIAQVRAVYGEAEANTIIENCDNTLILRCGASEKGGTARFASQVIGEREVEREETTTSQSRGRSASSSTSQAVRRHREPAVMDSEIMQLETCSGYLKLATRPEWLRVTFQPISFPAQAEAWVPVPRPTPAAAE